MGTQSFCSRVIGVLGLFGLLGLAACTAPDSEGFRIGPAPEKVEDSFQIQSHFEAGQKHTLIGLKKTSLEKYFLMIPQMRMSEASSGLTLFEPQVVYFKATSTQVGLFELNTAVIFDDIASERLVQSFPISSETDDYVFFEWTHGLDAIVQRSPYDSSSAQGLRRFSDGIDDVLDVVSSFMEKAEFVNNELRFRQLSRVRHNVLTFRKDPGALTPEDQGEAGSVDAREFSVTLDLVLRPYEPSVGITPQLSKLDKGFGFFTRPLAHKSWSDVRNVILRWDIAPAKGPIRVRVSSKVPTHLLAAVSEGVQYWNRILGRSVLVVETGADPQAALEERTIMIHWVDWRDAGFAYAGFQADPLTGEILQGQVFMTSSWELAGLSYDQLRGSLARVMPQPRGFQLQNAPCSYHHDIAFAWADHPGLLTGTTGAPGAETSLEHVIRHVVAHEMGHALGLRHNFAASFYSPLTPEETWQKADEFLKKGTIAAVATATSVMDYSTAIDDVLGGKYILNGVMDYDRKVMAWAYLGDNSEKSLNFCSDENLAPAKRSLGCAVFDSSRRPLEMEARLEKLNRDRGLWREHAQLMVALFPEKGLSRDVDEVLNAREKLIANQPTTTRFTAARDIFSEIQPIYSTVNLKDWEKPEVVEALKKKAWLEQVEALGLLQLFDMALPWTQDVDTTGQSHWAVDQVFWSRQLDGVLKMPQFNQGTTGAGVSFVLPTSDRDRVEKYLKTKLTASALQPGLVALAQAWPGPKKSRVNPVTRKPETKDFVYQAIPSLKGEMPQVLQRTLTLMRTAKSLKTVVVNATVSLDIPELLFATDAFNDWPALFDPRYNLNSDKALVESLLAGMKENLADIYALWGVPTPEAVATTELRRLFTEKSAALPKVAKDWAEAELRRIEYFEKSFSEKPATSQSDSGQAIAPVSAEDDEV